MIHDVNLRDDATLKCPSFRLLEHKATAAHSIICTTNIEMPDYHAVQCHQCNTYQVQATI